jgi:hypothetical protein
LPPTCLLAFGMLIEQLLANASTFCSMLYLDEQFFAFLIMIFVYPVSKYIGI